MKQIMEAVNKPVAAFKRADARLSWSLVGVTIGLVVILDPVLSIFAAITPNQPGFDFRQALLLVLAGVATYGAICTAFWVVGRIFGSPASWQTHLRTWGITYIPTLLCALLVAITENYFFLFWNSLFWSLFFSIAFVGLLIWKTVLYVLYFREVAQLRRGRLVGALVLGGLAILLLTLLDVTLALKTPIL